MAHSYSCFYASLFVVGISVVFSAFVNLDKSYATSAMCVVEKFRLFVFCKTLQNYSV